MEITQLDRFKEKHPRAYKSLICSLTSPDTGEPDIFPDETAARAELLKYYYIYTIPGNIVMYEAPDRQLILQIWEDCPDKYVEEGLGWRDLTFDEQIKTVMRP